MRAEGLDRAPPAIRADAIRIEAPENFGLETDYDGVISFLHKLREEIKPGTRRQVIADMRSVRVMSPAAALCLASEFDRWQRIVGKKLQPLTVSSWDRKVLRHLFSMGLFELLGTRIAPHLRASPSDDIPIWLKFSSQTVIDGSIPKHLRKKIEQALGSLGNLRQPLYGPLLEAIKNAVEHAYPDGSLDDYGKSRLGPRWWMLGVAEPAKRRIGVIVLDQGITIPGSLPSSGMWRQLQKVLGTSGDGDKDRIAAAVEYGKTRTRLDERGKGLSEIIGLAARDPSNHVRIYSRNGFYQATGSMPGTVEARALPLAGTLIQWDLQVPTMKPG